MFPRNFRSRLVHVPDTWRCVQIPIQNFRSLLIQCVRIARDLSESETKSQENCVFLFVCRIKKGKGKVK